MIGLVALYDFCLCLSFSLHAYLDEKNHAKTQQKSGLLQARKRSSPEKDTDLGLLVSRTVREKFPLFKLPSLW